MLIHFLARSLLGLVPEKMAATVSLLPDGPSPTTVRVFNAWLKPLSVRLSNYGNLNLQGDETSIHVPDHELNPASEGREIRARDRIVIGNSTYIVLSAQLKSVRTVWECTCRKEIL
jgi:hypothetical protein